MSRFPLHERDRLCSSTRLQKLAHTFALFGTKRCSGDEVVAVALAVEEVVAAVLAATEEGDVLHGGEREKRAD